MHFDQRTQAALRDVGLDDAEIREASDAVAAAVERDTASGNGLVLARVTADGVDLREYDTAGAVGEDEGVVN